MSAQIIQFPRLHRDVEDRLFEEWKARSDAALAADPEKQALLAKAQSAIAKLPRRTV